MFRKFNLKELLNDGLKEIILSDNMIYSVLFHIIIPLIIAIILILFNVFFDNDIISNLISSISIFSGLLFSVIFVVIDNYSKRRDSLGTNPNEEKKNYLKRYKIFTESVTTLILFSVAIACITVIILLTYLLCYKGDMSIWKDIFDSNNETINFSQVRAFGLWFLQIVSCITLFNYVLVIIVLINEVYKMVFDDINHL